jgi:hypothetical protein
MVFAILATPLPANEDTEQNKSPALGKVYGEWLIRVKPDKGPQYKELIEREGLPLFRAAGGRMVGWWNTLIGDLYEQVTIWEYDSMEAFEKAVASLGASEPFAEFVKLRDPLLAGEKSRFLRLADGAKSPKLPELAATVIHETHHVPADRMGDYVHFMQTEGLSLLKGHGFRPVGPFVVEVGKWSEVTMLFPFESLVQRDRLKTAFEAQPEFNAYNSKLRGAIAGLVT